MDNIDGQRQRLRLKECCMLLQPLLQPWILLILSFIYKMVFRRLVPVVQMDTMPFTTLQTHISRDTIILADTDRLGYGIII